MPKGSRKNNSLFSFWVGQNGNFVTKKGPKSSFHHPSLAKRKENTFGRRGRPEPETPFRFPIQDFFKEHFGKTDHVKTKPSHPGKGELRP